MSWCHFHFCLYDARRGLVKSTSCRSLWSSFMGFTAVKSTVSLSLIEHCPPDVNPEFVMVFPRIQLHGSVDFSSFGIVHSRHDTGPVNSSKKSSMCFVMKYCPTSTVFRNPAWADSTFGPDHFWPRPLFGRLRLVASKGGWGEQNFALFSLSCHMFLSLWGSLRGILVVCLKCRGTEMCTFGVLGLLCDAPAAQSRLQKTPKFNERTPKRGRKKENCGRRGKK